MIELYTDLRAHITDLNQGTVIVRLPRSLESHSFIKNSPNILKMNGCTKTSIAKLSP